tara:strand:+ start:3917 stop:5062 length:1146 start_codon:yes stop_codon:yes gene_type:complete
MSEKSLTFALVAGEVSGDILGEGLIQSLKARYPEARFVGIGGPKMQAQGLESFFDMNELAVMGVFEVLGRLPRLLHIMRELTVRVAELEPACFIGIDAPDFNLRVEKKLKRKGIKTIQYVSPSIWAWRPKRIFTIEKATNMVLSLLPFEKKFYDRHQVPCTFVGHTLADQVAFEHDPIAMRKHLGLNPEGDYLAVLPGSRYSEVKRLAPPFFQALTLLAKEQPQKQIMIPCVHAGIKARIVALQDKYAPELKIHYFDGQSREVMIAANQVLLASGTAALEAMLLKRPMVVAYKVNPLTYMLGLRLMHIKHFSLPNLLSEEVQYVPELIQHDCYPEKIASTLLQQQKSDKTDMFATFSTLHHQLKQNANEKAAIAVSNLLKA